LISRTLRTVCSCSPRRYTRGFVCRSGRAGPAVAIRQDVTRPRFRKGVVRVNAM
jgi:hypothetical protein